MLKEFKKKADEAYWEELWEKVDLEKELQYNFHSPLLKIFKKHLPKKGVILEGGCGNGQWVEVLRQEGYGVLGLDYAPKTVKKIKKIFPKCSFVVGDLTKLKYDDNHFAAHISRGVIEHFEEGPSIINAEITRTLKRKGVLIITTPYYNPIKRLKYFFKASKKGNGHFYQYHLSKKELFGFFKDTYKLKEVYYINPFKTISDEIVSLRSKKKKTSSSKKKKSNKKTPQKISRIKKLLITIESNKLFGWLCGHSVCLVLIKK